MKKTYAHFLKPLLMLAIMVLLSKQIFAQSAPNISYSGAQTYMVGKAINPVSPTNTGGAVPATIYGQVTTFAGNGSAAYADGPVTSASFNTPNGVATDAAGNVYVADAGNNRIRKITPAGLVTTLAGNDNSAYINGTGQAASFVSIVGVATDAAGNVYVSDAGDNRIRKISAAGVVTTLAGNGQAAYADGTDASFNNPSGIATDAAGNVYVADAGNNRIRKISPDGVVTTLAGNDIAGYLDGPGKGALFYYPTGVATDAAGNVYVADELNNRIRMISPLGVVTTLAGSNTAGSADGTGTAASFNQPGGIATDAAGNVYVVDWYTNLIRKITTAGVVTALAGSGSADYVDGTGTLASFDTPNGIATDALGNVYVGDNGNNRIRKISLTGYSINAPLPLGLIFEGSTGTISGTPLAFIKATTYTITAYNLGGSSTTTLNLTVNLPPPPQITYSGAQSYTLNTTITSISPTNTGGAVPPSIFGNVTTFAGNGNADNIDGQGAAASFSRPSAVATDKYGNVFVSDVGNALIRKINPMGYVTTFAGGGYGSGANFSNPSGLTIDALGNLYSADESDAVIRKVDPMGNVITLAGSGSLGSRNGKGTAASFNSPEGLAVDTAGNVYVADAKNNLIRKIDPTGNVTTFAGTKTAGYYDGKGAAASFNSPVGIAIDATGNLYVADQFNNRIRKIDPLGNVTTLAGSGTPASINGKGIAASFYYPKGIAVDVAGNVYVGELGSYLIRKIDSIGNVTTLAGSGLSGSTNGQGTAASFYRPGGLATDAIGNVYVADQDNHLIRKISITGYSISPKLPAGLNFDGATGTISGTPTSITPATTYTITGYNLGGSSTTTLTIAVADSTSWRGGIAGKWNDSENWTNGIPSGTLAPIFTSSAIVTVPTGSFVSSFPFFKLLNSGTNVVLNQATPSDAFSITDKIYIQSGAALTINNSANLSFPGLNIFSGSLTLNNCTGTIGNANCIGSGSNLYITNSTIAIKLLNIGNDGTFNASSSIINNNGSITNNGNFTLSNSSGINLTGTGNILNGGGSTASPLTAYFYVDPTSYISMGGSGQIVNINPNTSPETITTGEFVLQSNKDNSATILLPASSNTVLGKYRVQRYITGNNSSTYRGYRLISSPVNAVSAAAASTNYVDFGYINQSFTDGNSNTYYGVATGGPGGSTSGFSLNNSNPLLYLYREDYNPINHFDAYSSKYPGITSVTGLGTTTPTIAWQTSIAGVTPSTGTTNVPAGNGLLFYYTGPNTRSNLSSATLPDNSTITYFGYINQGIVPCYPWFTPTVNSMSYTSSITMPANAKGVNLVGNPYPSIIDLRMVYADNTNFTSFYELDDISHGYLTYSWNGTTETTSGGNASRFVASGQGFFVQATGTGQSLSFNPDQQVYNTYLLNSNFTPAGVLILNGDQLETIHGADSKTLNTSVLTDLSGLHLMLKLDSINFRETGIYFNKNWSDNKDSHDALDLVGSGQKLFLSSYTADGLKVSINGMGSYLNGKNIKLYVQATSDGTYSLNLSDIKNIDQSITNVYLIDHYKRDTIDLVSAKTYGFYIINSDTNSFGSNRFALTIKRKPIAPYQLVLFNGSRVNNNISIVWQTVNEGDYTGFGLQKLDIASNKYYTIDSLQSIGIGNYTFNDPGSQIGYNTYRLAQSGIDGAVTYSKPVTIKYGLLSKQNDISVFPNPVTDNALIDFSGLVVNQSGSFSLSVYNTLGRLEIEERNVNTNFLNVNLSSLQPGVHLLNIKSSTGDLLGKTTFIKK